MQYLSLSKFYYKSGFIEVAFYEDYVKREDTRVFKARVGGVTLMGRYFVFDRLFAILGDT